MTTPRKVEANRANARASTGPRTALGKTRAARNSYRHGLNVPLLADPGHSEQVEALTRAIMGDDPDIALKLLARDVAEAQLNLVRVRQARQDLIACPGEQNLRHKFRPGLVGRRRRAKMQRKTTLEVVRLFVRSATANIPGLFDPSVEALERYERRAMARRKFAIRAFDALRSERSRSKATT